MSEWGVSLQQKAYKTAKKRQLVVLQKKPTPGGPPFLALRYTAKPCAGSLTISYKLLYQWLVLLFLGCTFASINQHDVSYPVQKAAFRHISDTYLGDRLPPPPLPLHLQLLVLPPRSRLHPRLHHRRHLHPRLPQSHSRRHHLRRHHSLRHPR